jgi:hypothetical protein
VCGGLEYDKDKTISIPYLLASDPLPRGSVDLPTSSDGCSGVVSWREALKDERETKVIKRYRKTLLW